MPTGAGGGSSSPKGWPVAFYTNGAVSAGTGPSAGNDVAVWGFGLLGQVVFSNISVFVQATDASAGDFGIYNKAGTLLANLGATVFGSAAITTTAVLQAPVTLNPGLYMFAMTRAGSTLAIYGDPNLIGTWITNLNVASSSAGVLPASITAQTVSVSRAIAWFALS